MDVIEDTCSIVYETIKNIENKRCKINVMKRVLSVVMILFCLVNNKIGYAQDENKKWVISMFEGYIEDLKERSEPVIFEDNFIGFQEMTYPNQNDNFKKMNPVIPEVSKEAIAEIGQLIQESLRLHFNNSSPYSIIGYNDIQYDISKVLGITNDEFKTNRIYSMYISPLSVGYLDDTRTVGKENFITRRQLIEEYGKLNEHVLMWIEDDKVLPALEKEFWNRSGDNHEVLVKSTKPVKTFEYEAIVPIPSTKIIKLSNSQAEVSTVQGTFKLKRLNGNRVRIEVPPFLYRTMDIYGIYKDGKILEEVNRIKRSTYTPEQMKDFKKWEGLFAKALKDINVNPKYNDADLTNILSGMLAKREISYKPIIDSYEIEFAGPVDHVQINLYGILDEPKVFKFIKEFSYKDKELILCKDISSGKIGIIGVDGKWIVQPMFSKDIYMLNQYIIKDVVRLGDEYLYKYYWLDLKEKSLKELSGMSVYSTELCLDTYMIMKSQENKKLGVMNIKTGEIVIPCIYNHVHFDKDKWRVTLGEVEAYLSLEGKLL